MRPLEPDTPLTVLGANGAAVVESIVADEKAERGWADFVTAGFLMQEWWSLVQAIEEGAYPEHMMVEEYANDLYARKLLQTVIEASPDEIAEKLSQWIAPLDARFTAATVRANHPFHGSADADSAHAASPWHWRIPKSPRGCLARDLSRRGLI
ncbi:MAG: hypothetical protein MSC31_09815 [Solirubrobacteraceae bacterium MAG38_C4-C5]|nr:hypothetical protein [Candidatus Siliceabacter maunaloa]